MEARPEEIPPWLWWFIWVTVEAFFVVVLGEVVKRALKLKEKANWQTAKSWREKSLIMLPWLVLFGMPCGWLALTAGGLLDNHLQRIMLGGMLGGLSFTFYDIALGIPSDLYRKWRKTIGVDTTTMDTVEPVRTPAKRTKSD